ncbi:uncharacterized protein LOC121411687 [Lytechinus variegatus]|uniref:uncharacterized protein LOC121411687 n=1 Tax=Lytechinus variegatus TaxID=7654 RepID=UPI001BB239FE|nr:uncharacterized protein LOC121411687 [Lytechinus variegatus]XP_041460447.1 uncharacterized protein LOC121411687 [Lytechinus variegatus]
MKAPYVIILLACIILHGNGDDSEEGTDDDSSEEQVPAQTYCPRCHPNPDPSSTVCGVVGGIYRTTFRSECHLRQVACLNGNVQSRVVHWGACMTRPPVTTRVPTTRRIKPTPRVTPAPTTRRTTTATTTTMAPAMTTPCPDSCDLVLEPVCTTVGTYQSECTFNLVRCRGIIASTETILHAGRCIDTSTAGP